MSTDAVVIWGELLWDRFPDGEQLGGAPANVAYHLGLAGGWPQLVTRIGDDEPGRRALARLADIVDTSLVQIDPERETGEVTIEVVDGEPRYTLVPGRAWERIACTDAVRTAIGEAGVFVFGTLAQRMDEGFAAWREAVAAAKDTCIRVCDLNLRPGDAPQRDGDASDRRGTPSYDVRTRIVHALDVSDLVKVNDRELAALRDWLGWADPLARLRERARVVAVTHGAAGSTLYGDAGVFEIAGVAAAPGGDNVGCGDAYLALLVHGLTLGWDLEASGRAASRWAAAVASVRGATPAFSDEQIARLLEPA